MSKTAQNKLIGDGTQTRSGAVVGTGPDEDGPVPAKPISIPAPAVKPIDRDRVQLVEFRRQTHVAYIPNNVTPEDIQKPSYWINLQHHLKPLDHIEAYADNGMFYVELLVRSVSFNTIDVTVLLEKELDKVDPSFQPPSEYSIEHGGLYEQWRVLRGADVLVTKMPNYSAAQAWLKDHLIAMRR